MRVVHFSEYRHQWRGGPCRLARARLAAPRRRRFLDVRFRSRGLRRAHRTVRAVGGSRRPIEPDVPAGSAKTRTGGSVAKGTRRLRRVSRRLHRVWFRGGSRGEQRGYLPSSSNYQIRGLSRVPSSARTPRATRLDAARDDAAHRRVITTRTTARTSPASAASALSWEGATRGDFSHAVWLRKKAAFDAIADDRLHIVGPSKWIAAEAARSSLLKRFPVSVIPYGLDTGLYGPSPGAQAARSVPAWRRRCGAGAVRGRLAPAFAGRASTSSIGARGARPFAEHSARPRLDVAMRPNCNRN